MKLKTLLTTATVGAMALSLVAAHPGTENRPKGNPGVPLELSDEVAELADDTFGALEGESGVAKLRVDLRRDLVCIDAEFTFDVDLLHIHEKSDTDGDDNPQTGPVVVSWQEYIDFDNTVSDGDTSTIAACATIVAEGFDIQDLLRDKDEYYLNAHQVQEDGTAPVVRAELRKPDVFELELTTEAAEETNDDFGALQGASGEATVVAHTSLDIACVDATFEGERIDLLHIHEKDPASANPQTGPVVVQFTPTVAEDGMSADGCVDAGAFDLEDLDEEPEEYYLNAHQVQSVDPLFAPVIRAEFADAS